MPQELTPVDLKKYPHAINCWTNERINRRWCPKGCGKKAIKAGTRSEDGPKIFNLWQCTACLTLYTNGPISVREYT